MLWALKGLPVNLIPETKAANIINSLTNVKTAIDKIKEFKIEIENAPQERDGRANPLIQHIQEVDEYLPVWIAFLSV